MHPRNAPLPASFTPEAREALFGEIMRLYDLADQVLASVAKEGLTNREAQMTLAIPFVEQTLRSTGMLVAIYTAVARGASPVTPQVREAIAEAFESFFDALHVMIEGMENTLLPQKETV